MSLIVKKFGGTSVAGDQRMHEVAKAVKRAIDDGDTVVVVVSAEAGFTNYIVDRTYATIDVSPSNANIHRATMLAERDVALSAGEQISAGLVALQLLRIGVNARTFLAWQLPISTNDVWGNASISSICAEPLLDALNAGITPVVAGFQGICGGRLTTIGRGGSDTSAVAIAIAVKADRCDIYTDVKGIYTADPRVVNRAKLLSFITYEEMAELAFSGSKVLHARSVGLAMCHNMNLRVLSSFDEGVGTFLSLEDSMEGQLITGIALSNKEAQIVVRGIEHNAVCDIFEVITELGVNVDMIVQNDGLDGSVDLAFTVDKDVVDVVATRIEQLLRTYLNEKIQFVVDKNVAKVVIVGIGMMTTPGVAYRMLKVMREQNVRILAISTSEIKISALVPDNSMELVARILHTEYGLDA